MIFSIINWHRLWERSFASHTIAFRTKSYMVLTRLMTTTINAQGDEPRNIALERQVQTLIATIERLT